MKEAVTHQGRVLILAPTGEDATVLRSVLASDGLRPCVCGSMEDLCEGIDEISGTAIIAEETITPISIVQLSEVIRRQPEWSDFPLIIMTSAGTPPDRVWSVMSTESQSLNATVLVRPVLTRTLLTAVRSNLRSRSAQYRVAEELRRRREAEASLTTANEELSAFSHSISHDLRAPLRIMKGFSTLLIQGYSDKIDETGREFLTLIDKGADQMGRLIEDMLSLSKITQQEMAVQEINLSAIAQEIIAALRGTLPSRQVEIVIHDDLKALGDEQLLKIALTNLLGNAWKYSSKMSHSRIEFGGFQKDNETVFFVRDNGAGFDMAYAGRLFKPFQRLHSEGEFPGTGIGLTIVHRVILRHGGRIWAEAEVGKGATFYFTLQQAFPGAIST